MTPGLLILVSMQLVELHKLDGRIAYVNPEAVVQISESREAIGEHNQLFTDEVMCIITLNNRTYITVKETCEEVRLLFTIARPPREGR